MFNNGLSLNAIVSLCKVEEEEEEKGKDEKRFENGGLDVGDRNEGYVQRVERESDICFTSGRVLGN